MGTDDMEADGTSPFDAIRHEDSAGNEYWSARELAKVLGYTTNFRNFHPVIAKAETSCESSGYATSDHFAHVRTMIGTGKGAQRAAEDVHLSRYACYLVVMNGDPDKPIIAAGQTYFAEQTRRQELADEAALAGLSEAQRRLFVRKQLRAHNKQLAANLFRATQTEEKLQREGISDKDLANRTHHDVGAAVRRTIAELGGTMPEDLPTPEQSIKQLQSAEQKRLEAERQPSLFDSHSDDKGANE